jgi:MFS superfamily sulfate permease-like transporter
VDARDDEEAPSEPKAEPAGPPAEQIAQPLGDRPDPRGHFLGAVARLPRSVIFGGNRYDLGELAGAFGDLGTLLPFVIGYITINKLDPAGILLSFGLFKVFTGFRFKTPMPIQPMKAIGAEAIAHPGLATPGVIWGSGIFTAVFWTLMAVTGAIGWLEKIAAKPVMRGIMLGLGISLIINAVGLAGSDIPLAVGAGILTLILLSWRKFPAMLVLLVLGIAYTLLRNTGLVEELSTISLHFRLPEITLGRIGWNDLVLGTLALGLAQAPLTLGNAILGVVAENNELFPDRPVKAKTIALDHGFMNFISAAIGGVPLCHGAGGMAGHVRFGARTGGALVILGLLLTFTALFLSDSVVLLFSLIPSAILGVILFFTGIELALTVRDMGSNKQDIYVMILTAGLAVVNMGVGFTAGVILYYAIKKLGLRV